MSTREAPALVVLAAGQARRYGGCKPLAPVGPGGEAVIDLLGSDAVAAGFGRIVFVLHPETGPAVRYHVERCWPGSIPVDFAEQPVPLGTVDAVLAARSALDPGRAFAVSNADDVYGEAAMAAAAEALQAADDEHVLVAYELRSTVTTTDPVTRGICELDRRGYLTALTERRQVARSADGTSFTSGDGRQPEVLDGAILTSVNLWGFRPEIWSVLAGAVAASGLAVDAAVTGGAEEAGPPRAEVLLPEVIAAKVAAGEGLPVRVVATGSQLVGVTHATDLPAVAAELERLVALGIRSGRLWDRSG
ncbi:MAG: NTP transferase domain-containing protein [Acidimicrobiales bacterium]